VFDWNNENALDYHTRHLINQQSDLYVFCYDYGYLALDDGRCLIVKSRGGDAFTL
jgi:hypothetical protein